ncbi:hypothetical protein CEXT_673491, partial [Caerostris extrusa]
MEHIGFHLNTDSNGSYAIQSGKSSLLGSRFTSDRGDALHFSTGDITDKHSIGHMEET